MAGSLRGGSSVWCKGRVDGVVLAERMALPVLGEQDPPEVRMALEADAEHVVALALHPVGAAVEPRQRGAARLPRAEARPHRQDEPGDEVLDAADDLQPLLLPVDGGQPVEVAAAELSHREAPERKPLLARVPQTTRRSDWRGDAHGTIPTRSTSNGDANVAIISIAQQASPNVTGQIDDLRAQLKIFSVVVVTIQPPGM